MPRRAGIEGKVYVLAYVNEEGTVTKTEILKGIGGGCDEAAEYAVKHTKFSPGKQRGKPVKVKVMVPVVFKLGKWAGIKSRIVIANRRFEMVNFLIRCW